MKTHCKGGAPNLDGIRTLGSSSKAEREKKLRSYPKCFGVKTLKCWEKRAPSPKNTTFPVPSNRLAHCLLTILSLIIIHK